MLSKRFQNDWSAKIIVWSFVVIVAAMPVHTFFTTWIGSNFGAEEIFKAWKEILLFFNTGVLLGLYRRHKTVIKPILVRPVNILIYAYIGWHLIDILIRQPELDAAIAGTMINGRFLSIFVMAQVVVELVKRKTFENFLQRTFITGAGFVAAFGTLQALILDKDFLTHFGYSKETVRPFMTLDANDDLIRISSTLRGPNPLGSYLIFPILVIVNWLKRQVTSRRLYLLMFMGVAMLFTFSRSAWLGLGIALVVWCLLVISRYPAAFTYTIAGLIFATLLGLSVITIGRDSYIVQTFVLHDDPNTGAAITSNEEHLSSLAMAAEDILEDPLGDGPGTAGPASRYNSEITRIGENYFLQVGQEVGIIGLALFLAINMRVAIQLWRKRHQPWPRMLFASFVGLSVISLFLHGWTDDATAITWWAFAGLYYK